MIRARVGLAANPVLLWVQRGCPAPAPDEVRVATLLYYLTVSGSGALVETGAGDGAVARVIARSCRVAVHALEPSAESHARAVAEDGPADGRDGVVHRHPGGGGGALAHVLRPLRGPVLIVLKAPPPAGWSSADGAAPILGELTAVLGHPDGHRHTVLVEGMHRLGFDGLPPADLVEGLLRHGRPGGTVHCQHDILRALPAGVSDRQSIDFGALCQLV